MTMLVTRFAPSPTGFLHLGHACSALFAWRQGGEHFLLRIEDIDFSRRRQVFIDSIYEDLAWLGFDWPKPVRLQSEHMEDYAKALARLEAMRLLYPCFCTRADIASFQNAPQGPDGLLYSGRCKHLSAETTSALKAKGKSFALRLDVEKAMKIAGPLFWRDLDKGEICARPDMFGDVVLARKDTPASYHLAVTVDDALQGVNLVTRGDDLFNATHIHRLLQALLELPVPIWRHHRLLHDSSGRRLAKRDGAPSLRSMRENGSTPECIFKMLAE